MDLSSELFVGLATNERDAVERRLRARQFDAGAVILRQGGLSGELHIIRSGAVEVQTVDRLGRVNIVTRLGPGQCCGEMSLLTGQPHSADVVAAVPTETLVLARDDFAQLVGNSARLAQNLSRVLSERLYDVTRRQAGAATTVVAVASLTTPAAGIALALNLAVSLARQTRRQVLLATDRATLDGPLAPLAEGTLPSLAAVARDDRAAAAHRGGPPGHRALGGVRLCALTEGDGPPAPGQDWLDQLADTYGTIVIGPARAAGDDFAWASGASRAFLVGPAARLEAGVAARAIAMATGAGLAVDLVATDLPHQPSIAELAALGQASGARVARGLPVAAALVEELLPPFVRRERQGAAAAGIDWLARDIAGLKVGLALGAGSARGFAHLGVLRVLQRAGVPIDVLTGTSVGAVIAAGWAVGHSSDQIATALSATGPRLLHATIPYASLSGNGRFRTALRRFVGERRIEDLTLPFAAMAVDLATREPVILERGLLWEALLASASIPGIFPPVRLDGRLLIDGVVREPIPARAAAHLGGDVIIGVRLAPSHDSAASGPPPPVRPNLIDIVLGTIDLMQEAIESHGSQGAHLIIHPAVTRVTLREFEAGRALVEAGEAAAEETLPALRGLLPWMRPE